MKVIVLAAFIVVVSETSCVFIGNNTTRLRRQTTCGFRCRSGECIDEDLECDGAVNCSDGSDETDDCQKLRCPNILFRCKYGACINRNFECDGKQDCRDNSDETTPKCKTQTTSTSTCRKDEFACKSGECISEDDECDGKADCKDKSDETIEACGKLDCPGYTFKCVYGACVNGKARCNGKTECLDGSDEENCPSPKPPTVRPPTTTTTRAPVVRPPPPPTQRPIVGACALPPHPSNGKWTIPGATYNFSPGDTIQTGSIMQIQCNRGYIIEGNALNYCKDGQWFNEMPTCAKLCQPQYTSTPTTIVTCLRNNIEVNCTEATSGTTAVFRCIDYYEDRNLEINNQRVCYDGTWDYSTPNCIPEIHVPPDYKGLRQNYRADIAVLVTKTAFKLSDRVQFVCFSLAQDDDSRYLEQGSKGIVAGWGYEAPDSETPAAELKELEVPYVPSSQCEQALDKDFLPFLTDDKFCAGYLNEKKSVCMGDSGSAIVFKNRIINRYFPLGVVSVSPIENGACSTEKYALYTRISRYNNWIERIRRSNQ